MPLLHTVILIGVVAQWYVNEDYPFLAIITSCLIFVHSFPIFAAITLLIFSIPWDLRDCDQQSTGQKWTDLP